MSMLCCPKCGFSLRPRAHYLTMDVCPRCLAKQRIAVELVRIYDPFPPALSGRSRRSTASRQGPGREAEDEDPSRVVKVDPPAL